MFLNHFPDDGQPEGATVVVETGVGIEAATGWGTLRTGADSSRAIGVTFNFTGALLDFALIA